MAYKRRLVVERKAPEKEEDRYQELGWRGWLVRRYTRPWYWIGIMFLDMVIFFQAQWSLGIDLVGASTLTSLAILVELYIFIKIWGRNGPLGNLEGNE
jgi:hypothetical protein